VEYGAPFDQPAQIATIIASIAMLGSAMAVSAVLPDGDLNIIAKVYFALMILLVVVGWGSSIRSYEIGEKGFVIKSLFGRTWIRYEDILSTDFIPRLSHNEIVSRCGLFGIFGYRGAYRSDKIGDRFKLMCNRIEPAIIIETSQKTFLISPENARGFFEDLTKKIEG